METRANYIAVGFFTLVALVSAFAIAYWLGRFGERDNLVPVVVRVQGSVSGLVKGSLVQFNGIDVGRVSGLEQDPQDPRFVRVNIRVNKATPVRKDTRATIGIRGLSGGAFIQMEGGTPGAQSLLEDYVEGDAPPIITGDPAALSDLLERVNGIATRAETILGALETVVIANQQSATNTVRNVEQFSAALAQNSDGIALFMESAGEIAKSLDGLSGKLSTSLTQIEGILGAVEPEQIRSSIANVESFTKTLSDQRDGITQVLTSISNSAIELNNATQQINQTLKKVDGVVSAVTPEQAARLARDAEFAVKRASEIMASVDATTIRQSVDDASQTIARARSLVDGVDQQKINKTVDDLSGTVASARELVEGLDRDAVNDLVSELNNASQNVTKLLAAIDANRINKAVDDISGAAEGARKIVSDVDKVTSQVANRGDDVEQIITNTAELTRSLNGTAKQINGVIAQVDTLLNGDAGSGLLADVRETLSAFRQTARGLDARIAEVSRSLTNVTSRGLRDTQVLIRDAGQSLNRIDRVIRNLQNNPSSLITGAGGSQVRETTGGRPRR